MEALAKIEYETDTLIAEFHRLQEENVELGVDIPSEWDKRLRNLDRMGEIEIRLMELQMEVEWENKKARRAHLRVVK